MYQKEFNQLLKTSLPKSVLFFGDNDYLIDTYINYYIQKCDAKETLLSLYHDEWDFHQAKEYLSQSSLFGGINLLIVKSDKKIPKKELDTLTDLASRSSDNYFVFGFSGNANDAKTMQSSFVEKKGGVWVRFYEPTLNESVSILQQKATQLSLDIDRYAIEHLLMMQNNTLSLCVNELQKLSILQTKITSKEIDRLVHSTAPLAIESLLIALFHKKPIIQILHHLLELGEDEVAILRSAQYFINQLLLFHAYTKLNGNIDAKAILGYQPPKHIIDQKANIALKIKSQTLLKLYEHLLESEIILKKAPKIQKEALLYGILIRLQGSLE